MINCLFARRGACDFHAREAKCSCDGFGHTWVIFNVEDPDRGADVAELSFWIHTGFSHMTCNLYQRGRFRIASYSQARVFIPS